MFIGIDIDGVIVDTINHISSLLTKVLGYPVTPDDVAHKFSSIRGVEIIDQNPEYFYYFLPPIQDAVNVINRFNKQHEVFFISARSLKHSDDTMNWLSNYGLFSKKVIFLEGKSKVESCKNIGIEIFIEDSVVNAFELVQNGIEVILYKTEYNKMFIHEGVQHCDSWLEIEQMIEEHCLKRKIGA